MTPADLEARRYLLGETTEEESEAIERAYLAREEMLEAVLAAEDDLVEGYLSGRLSGETRQRFETSYLAGSLHRRRVEIARALRTRRSAVPRGRVWGPWAVAAALAAGVLGIVWRQQPPATEGLAVVAVTLPAVVVRGEGETPTARVPAGTAMVELRLERAGAGTCAVMVAAVRTVEGHEVWRGQVAPAPGEARGVSPLDALARIPAPRLPDGDYVVLLMCGGSRSFAPQRYFFRVSATPPG